MEKIWQKSQEELKKSLGKISFDTWIAPLKMKSFHHDTAVLEVPDIFFKNWLESNYIDAIKSAFKTVTGKEVSVGFEVNPSLLKRRTNKIFHTIGKTFQEETQDSLKLNPVFTFDQFIVGACNRMAHAASLAVANAPGRAYNPLFIYGGVGLGKTHLMQAIAHYIKTKSPAMKVKYGSSETFTNELIMSIQKRTTPKFRQKYRDMDVLLIDDVQFLAGKEAVQEEFFHTFNVLYDNHKQIVVSSDRPPREIPRLEERLVSRFNWGLVVDVQPPDLETRIAILKKKLENEPIQISPEVLYFIAENITTNIRELQGALVRIIAYSLIESKPISVEIARNILKDMMKEINKKITPKVVIEKVAEYFNVSAQDLKRTKRSKSLALPRQIVMYLARKFTDMSLPEIGDFMGAKHHTTVLYAVRKMEETLKQNSKIKKIVETISQEIKRK